MGIVVSHEEESGPLPEAVMQAKEAEGAHCSNPLDA